MAKSAISRIIGVFSSITLWLALAQGVLAQTSSTASAGSKGGTTSSLPAAGTTEWTYLIFIGGAILFVIGAVKLVLSFRDSS